MRLCDVLKRYTDNSCSDCPFSDKIGSCDFPSMADIIDWLHDQSMKIDDTLDALREKEEW